MNRREFLILSAAAAAGCATGSGPAPDNSNQVKSASIDAGLATDFAKDGVYDQFRMQGFFVVRKGDQLFALSSICTHRHYRLEVSADDSFFCKSHGSCFDQSGKVTIGPADRDLPKLPISIDGRGHLIILGLA